MQNDSERLHYAIALGLGVVGLLIILIFVSIRSQADTTSPQTTVTITSSTPTVLITGFGSVSTGESGTMDLSAETNVLANSVSNTIHVYASITDANGCYQMSSPGYKYFKIAKDDDVGCTGSSASSSVSMNTCFNNNSIFAASTNDPAASCTYSCGNDGTTIGYLDCTVNIPYRTPNGSWTATVYANDGALSGSDTSVLTIQPNKAIKITGASSNTAKTTIIFGEVAVGSTSTEDRVDIYNVGNTSASTLSISGSRMTCTAGSEPTIDTSSVKYATTEGTAISSGSSVSSTAVTLVAAFDRTPQSSWLSGSTSAVSSTWWALNLTSEQGVGGTCTGTANIILL